LLGIIVMPDTAFAWGAGVHLALGNSLLGHLQLLTEPVAQILRKESAAFLYGCLSADILIGKGKKLTPRHCHSWNAGFQLLNSQKSSGLLAYAYGYLSHLAADVIAHNYYVPNMLQLKGFRGKLNHVYLEMQADQSVAYSEIQLKDLMKASFKEADKELLMILQKSNFVFSFKKRIYRSGLALARNMNGNRGTIRQVMKSRSDQIPEKEYLEDMLELSFQVVTDCLNRQVFSPVCQYDPMGFDNLRLVKNSERQIFSLARKKRSLALFFMPSMNLLTT
jgi:hypothetical protein